MEKVETYKQPPLPLQPPPPLPPPPPPPPPPPSQQFDDIMVYSKIMKKKQKKKKRLNMRRTIYYPKSPLMIFSELFKYIPIHLQEHSSHNTCKSYTATLEIDGQMYYGNDISMTEAKEEACENFFRIWLAKQLCEQSEFSVNAEMEFKANRRSRKEKDFPWPHFLSLAMHNLLNQWKIQPVESVFLKPRPKIVFPKNPKKYNPIQLLHHMKPGIKFTKITFHKICGNCHFQVNCVVDGILFTGQGQNKRTAKKECCIAAIKYFWQFDFHAIKYN